MMQIKSVLNTVMLRMHDNTDGGARVVYLCCGGIVVARSWGLHAHGFGDRSGTRSLLGYGGGGTHARGLGH